MCFETHTEHRTRHNIHKCLTGFRLAGSADETDGTGHVSESGKAWVGQDMAILYCIIRLALSNKKQRQKINVFSQRFLPAFNHFDSQKSKLTEYKITPYCRDIKLIFFCVWWCLCNGTYEYDTSSLYLDRWKLNREKWVYLKMNSFNKKYNIKILQSYLQICFSSAVRNVVFFVIFIKLNWTHS